MKKARVVIGANFGDEGKGLVTDYLSSRAGPETLIVRFNGGAQAGHTVTTPDGKRHVFGHFGSGCFNGCPTFLSRFFICNPLVFLKEIAGLRTFGVEPLVYIDPAAPVTTPYDMMINQCVEEARGANKHGSCGLGFGETIERNLRPAFALTFADLAHRDLLRRRLAEIRDSWVLQRLRALGLTHIPPAWDKLIFSPRMLETFIEDIGHFLRQARMAPADLLSGTDSIIFEGAQGLLLDQDYGCFPHVTRSNTGLKNVAALAYDAGLTELDVYYLTRSYLTRHGAGPMPNECFEPPYSKIQDPTNIPNPYQGALRFGLLDLDLLSKTIFHDLRHVPSSVACTYRLSVSCMDQIDDDQALCIAHGQTLRLSSPAFLARLQQTTGAASLLASYGPTRRDVRRCSAQPMHYARKSAGGFIAGGRESLCAAHA